MTWVAVGAMVAAAALTAYNGEQTAKKQDRAVSQGILQRMAATRDQSDAIQKALAQMRDSNAQPVVDQAKGSYLHALAQNPTMGTQPSQVGALSDAYRQAAGAAANDSAAQASKTAGLMAITDAPALQRQDEAHQVGLLGAKLTGIGINANDASNIARLKAMGIRPNPWIGLAATALSAYGSAAGGGAAPSSSASNANTLSTDSYWGNSGSGGLGTSNTYTGPGSTATTWGNNANTLYGV